MIITGEPGAICIATVSSVESWSIGTSTLSIQAFPSAVMERRTGSPPPFRAETCLASGSWTGFPRCSIGVMTMKMMRSTSTTSTSGVTLMSLFTDLLPRSIDIASGSWGASWGRCGGRYFAPLPRPSFMKKSTSSVAESVMSTCMSSTRFVR